MASCSTKIPACIKLVTRCGNTAHELVQTSRCLVGPGGARVAMFSTSSVRREKKSYKLVIVGGGTGGSAAAHIFSRKLGKGKVAVVEPSFLHYLQPSWTLVGGGILKYEDSVKQTGRVLPEHCDWIKDSAAGFDPENNTVTTSQGTELKYDFLLCAMGLQLNFNQIKGLPEAFEKDHMLCSNFSKDYVIRTRPALEAFKEGNAIFTFPNTPIKCPGAPQKIAYLADEFFRKNNKRDKADIIFNSSLGVLFGVKKYADGLWKVVERKNITVNLRHNLIEVRPETKEAVFEHLDTHEQKVFPYSMMHITPPMSTPNSLRESPLVDDSGYLSVDKETLQHTKYPNVFGIGDNTNIPTSKTAAAVASQTGILKQNLSNAMNNKPFGKRKYDGYTSCPLVTGVGKTIMAEFDWDGQPMETFPFDQGKERKTMYHVKKDILPQLYWKMLVKGYWHGPSRVRKALHLGMGR